MTKNIVQSDIDLARRLLESGRATVEVLAALQRRGLPQDLAVSLVQDLKAGRPVYPTPVVPVRTFQPAAEDDADDVVVPQPKYRQPGRRSRALLLASMALGLLLGGGFYAYRLQSHALFLRLERAIDELQAASPSDRAARAQAVDELKERLHGRWFPDARITAVLTVAEAGAAPQRATPKAVIVELKQGLRLNGQLLARSNDVQLLTQILGPATRVLPGRETTDKVYAFDLHGVLLHDRAADQTDFVVIDFDGAGGENGTTNGFSGSFVVEGVPVTGTTPAKEALALKTLELKDPENDGGILGGTYLGCDVIFAYLHSPARLNQVHLSLP